MLNARTLEMLSSSQLNLDNRRGVLRCAAFGLETVAHLEGVERRLLPLADELRRVDKALREAKPEELVGLVDELLGRGK